MKTKLIRLSLFAVAVLAALTLTACYNIESNIEPTEPNRPIELKDTEILRFQGGALPLMNTEVTTETVSTLEYVTSATYTLKRTSSYYSLSGSYVYYNDYYYYWDSNIQTETVELGTKTTTRTINYSYIPYQEDRGVLIIQKTAYKTSYDYSGGWIEKDVDVTVNVNRGYFKSFEELTNLCPELAALIDVSTPRKYYIDVTTPDSITYEEQLYDSFYYVESK